MPAVRRRPIRTLAKRLLKELNIKTAPVDVEQVAANLGVAIRFEPAEDNLSGFLVRDIKNHKAVIGVNETHSQVRQRFTIAHELGHFLLHEGEQLYVDRGVQINLRDEAASQGTILEEKEANLFAAELLMPAHFLKEDLADLDTLDLDRDIPKLAEHYKVSTQAMTFRLVYLKYLQI